MIIDSRTSALWQREQHPLRIEHVSMSFATGLNAIDDLSLTVPFGLCGVLGPVGAGKTTLLRILAAEHPPARGCVVFREIDPSCQPAHWQAVVSHLPHDFALPPAVPVCVALEHFALLRGFTSARERRYHVDALLDEVELSAVRGQHVGDLAPLLWRRLAIGVTLVGRPSLVLLDEPTIGLSTGERTAVLELMSRIASTRMVLFTTVDAADIGDWCAKLVALNRGRLLLEGAPDRLRDALRGCVWRASISGAQLDAVQRLHTVVGLARHGDITTVRVICAHAPGVEFVPVEPLISDVYHLYLPPQR